MPVVCTCTSYLCGSKEFRDESGEVQHGALVSTTTRTKHRAKDRALELSNATTAAAVSHDPILPFSSLNQMPAL